MSRKDSRSGLLRMIGTAVIAQGLVSLANLVVGLMLIRNESEEQYGHYVLATTTLLLLTGLQNAYFSPPMVQRLAHYKTTDRQDLVGGLVRLLLRGLPTVALCAAVLTALLCLVGVLSTTTALIVLCGCLSGITIGLREFFRGLQLAWREPAAVLKADVGYVLMLLGGAAIAIRTPYPSMIAVLSLGLAATVGALILARSCWRHEPWRAPGTVGLVRAFMPTGSWAVCGSAVHWVFSQGYTYLVVAALDVKAVGALAGTRLLLMPVNLMSIGISQVIMPSTARWLHSHLATEVFRRLLMLCVAVGVLTLGYCAVMWIARDWIFAVVLKRDFDQRDAMLQLWCIVFLIMIMRDQMSQMLVANQKFRWMTLSTLFSACIALAVSWVAMQHFGVVGAIMGVAIGELLNALIVALLSWRQSVRLPAAHG